MTKIQTTGVQQILNSIIFDVLDMIVVYPVEDETKLTNKQGQILPDARLLKMVLLQKNWHLQFIKILEMDFYMQLMQKQNNVLVLIMNSKTMI